MTCGLTGGSAGIGKATAFAFDANGAKVAVLGRRLDRLDAVVSPVPSHFARQASDTDSAVLYCQALERVSATALLVHACSHAQTSNDTVKIGVYLC